MANAIIKLRNPIEGHIPDPTSSSGGMTIGLITEIELREPKYADVMDLGEPAAFARSDSGMMYQAEKEEVIKGYIERLMVKPQDRALLQQVSLVDALQLKDAVYGFFQAAKQELSPKQ